MHAVATLVGIEAALVAVSYVLAGQSWGRACLYLLGLTAPLEVYRTTIADVNLSLFRMSIAIALATAVGLRLGARRRAARAGGPRDDRRAISGIEAAYVLLAVVIAASFAVHGEALFLGKRLVAVLVAGIVVIALCAELTRRTSVQALATAFVVGAVAPVAASFWQVLAPRIGETTALPFLSSLPVGHGLERTRDPSAGLNPADLAAIRLKGTFEDPNHFAVYLVFVLVIAAALALRAATARRLASCVSFGAVAVAAAATLVGTYSRSGWAAGLAATLITLGLLAPTLRARMTRRHALAAVAAATALLAVVVVPRAPTLAARLDPSSAVNAASNSLHRSNVEAGIDTFRDHPVFGVGVGKLGTLLDQAVRMSAADSTYVTVAAELGAVGLAALLLAGLTAIESLARAYRRRSGDGAAFVPAALIGAYVGFLGANLAYDQLWWRDFHFVAVGLILAVSVPRAGRAGSLARS